MNLALWIVAGLLAAVLLVSTSKAFVPKERIASVGHAAEWVLAAAGLILPAALGIAPGLVPVTASCVALLFVGAATMRLRRGERATVVPDLVYLALAIFVAWGRFGPHPFPA